MLRAVPDETLGATASLMTALSWGVAVVLFKRSDGSMGPIALNTFKNLVGLAMFLATIPLLDSQAADASTRDYLLLLGSGAVGIGIADSLMFAGLRILGASRQAIVDCFYSPAVVLTSYFWLGEVLTGWDAVGAVLIVVSVLLVVARRPTEPPRGERVGLGIIYSAVSVILMAVAIVWVKPVLERHDVLWSTTVRMVGGVGVLLLGAIPHRALRAGVRDAFRMHPDWRFAVPGAVMGTYVALLFWIAGFKYAPAGIAAILNQTSTLFIVLLAALFLGERLTARVGVSVAMAFAGSVMVLV